MAKGAVDRRLACLRIAASMLRETDKDKPRPPAEDVISYASKLSEWAYKGEGPGGQQA